MIRVSKSVVGSAEAAAVSRVIIEDGYLGMGKAVQEFEGRIRAYLGTNRSVICVNSGTAAMHLAVAASVPPGSEVLVQSLTYVATFQAISAAGAVPVPCEIAEETGTIDLADAERRLTPKTSAILPVHYASRTGDLDAIYAFARRHGLRVIEDAAHAFGGTFHGEMVGAQGDIVCFSFDGIKNVTSGEGGAVVTNDPGVAQYVMDARLLGVQKDTEKRYAGERSWELRVTHQGYRYHMSNMFAALGMVQLERFEREFKPKRQALARNYHRAFSSMATIQLFPDAYDTIVPHIFPIRVLNGKRDALRKHLLDRQVESGIHYYPNHLLQFYGARFGTLPVTERLSDDLLSLPLHPDITPDEHAHVIACVRDFFMI